LRAFTRFQWQDGRTVIASIHQPSSEVFELDLQQPLPPFYWHDSLFRPRFNGRRGTYVRATNISFTMHVKINMKATTRSALLLFFRCLSIKI